MFVHKIRDMICMYLYQNRKKKYKSFMVYMTKARYNEIMSIMWHNFYDYDYLFWIKKNVCVFISKIQSVVASTLIIWLNMVVGNILLRTRYRYQSTHEVGLDVLLLLCYKMLYLFFVCKGPIFGKIFVFCML